MGNSNYNQQLKRAEAKRNDLINQANALSDKLSYMNNVPLGGMCDEEAYETVERQTRRNMKKIKAKIDKTNEKIEKLRWETGYY